MVRFPWLRGLPLTSPPHVWEGGTFQPPSIMAGVHTGRYIKKHFHSTYVTVRSPRVQNSTSTPGSTPETQRETQRYCERQLLGDVSSYRTSSDLAGGSEPSTLFQMTLWLRNDREHGTGSVAIVLQEWRARWISKRALRAVI